VLLDGVGVGDAVADVGHTVEVEGSNEAKRLSSVPSRVRRTHTGNYYPSLDCSLFSPFGGVEQQTILLAPFCAR
jgi:hypothetical protein